MKFPLDLFSRFFSILPTNCKNIVSRKTPSKFEKFGYNQCADTFRALSRIKQVESVKIILCQYFSHPKDARNVKKTIGFKTIRILLKAYCLFNSFLIVPITVIIISTRLFSFFNLVKMTRISVISTKKNVQYMSYKVICLFQSDCFRLSFSICVCGGSEWINPGNQYNPLTNEI